MSFAVEKITRKPDLSELKRGDQQIGKAGLDHAKIGVVMIDLADAFASEEVRDYFRYKLYVSDLTLASFGVKPDMHLEKNFLECLKKPNILVERQAGQALFRAGEAWNWACAAPYLVGKYGIYVINDPAYEAGVFQNQGFYPQELVCFLRKRFTIRQALDTIIWYLT